MVAVSAGRSARPFGSDRYVLPLFVALVWTGILMGFVPEVVDQVRKGEFSYPWVVHVHAAAFVGWLALLTAQVALVRTGNLAVHRRLGVAGAVLAAAMVILGPAVAYVVDHIHYGTPKGDPPFLSIQILDIVNFACLAGAGLLLRKRAAEHKRLMLLATFCIVDAGFGRWWGPGLEALYGKGFFGEWTADYLGDVLLIVGLGFYDLLSRRRLYPAYLIGAGWGISLQLLAVYLYVSPWWKPAATMLIGH